MHVNVLANVMAYEKSKSFVILCFAFEEEL